MACIRKIVCGNCQLAHFTPFHPRFWPVGEGNRIRQVFARRTAILSGIYYDCRSIVRCPVARPTSCGQTLTGSSMLAANRNRYWRKILAELASC